MPRYHHKIKLTHNVLGGLKQKLNDYNQQFETSSDRTKKVLHSLHNNQIAFPIIEIQNFYMSLENHASH